MQYLSRITLPRLIALLAILSVLGWTWAALDGDMPVGFAFLLCVASPILLLMLTLYWTLDKGLGDSSATTNVAPPAERPDEEPVTRDETAEAAAEAQEPSVARS